MKSPVGKTLNAIALRDFNCPRCKHLIRKGAQLCMYRERALSYREAMHAGTMHPMRKICADCLHKDLNAAE